ncbi:alpha/beta hydrolase family protein [Actinomadura hibisca]|uniref:alpha/beta hydrolase family protein n=1 Tax=Actinomadura hibisca TaxID=68565 RepID=UPI00082CC9C4|nr:acetylxylan esterase [Actinomadura hibisca]
MRRLASVLSVVAVAGASLLATAPAKAAPPGDDTWSNPGPHPVATKNEQVTTFYYPGDIATSTRTHPVIVWGNGTFASPAAYDRLLRHWASHGFVVAAAKTAFSNSGKEMRAGIDRLATLNGQAGSPLRGKVDLARIGAAGHSQGGAGAINSGEDRRISTFVPVQPGPLASASTVHGPVLYLAGQKDGIVPPKKVRVFYDATKAVPAIYAERRGANHFAATGDGGGFRGVTTAWFRFHLMGDARARAVFFGPGCGICTDAAWSDVRRNAEAQQVPGA